ncbi:hypothetical protein SVIOM342S_10293 [Streptomyces violaceorubidus]
MKGSAVSCPASSSAALAVPAAGRFTEKASAAAAPVTVRKRRRPRLRAAARSSGACEDCDWAGTGVGAWWFAGVIRSSPCGGCKGNSKGRERPELGADMAIACRTDEFRMFRDPYAADS